MKKSGPAVRRIFLLLASGLGVLGCSVATASTMSANLTADNAFYAYLSTNDSTLGTLLASGNSWPTTFSFSGVTLAPGTSYLHIEAINYGGPGAFIGQFTLSDNGYQFANGTQTLLTGTSDWTGSYNDGNSDPNSPQAWVPAIGTVIDNGANGVGPWGNVASVSGSAHWIWPSDQSSCQFCTVDFSTTITETAPEPGTVALFGAGFAALALLRRRQAFSQGFSAAKR